MCFFVPFLFQQWFSDTASSPKLPSTVVSPHYLSSSMWLFPVQWFGDRICPASVRGNHWSLGVMIMNKHGIFFMHLDSCPSSNREVAFNRHVFAPIVRHMEDVEYADGDVLSQARIVPIRMPQQPGDWECGFYLMQSCYLLSHAETNQFVRTISGSTELLDIRGLYSSFDIEAFRSSILHDMLSASESQLEEHVDFTGSPASTWKSCLVLGSRTIPGHGDWWRLRVRATRSVDFWCKLPSSGTPTWWKPLHAC